jgi:hypothetical protein
MAKKTSIISEGAKALEQAFQEANKQIALDKFRTVNV